jgi:outer membrane protein assembly factor BamB
MRRARHVLPPAILATLVLLGASCDRDEAAPGTTAPGPSASATAPAATDGKASSWTQAAGNAQRTAATDEPGPRALPGIAWTNPVAREIVSEPVFGVAGGRSAVLMSSDKEVLAFELESGKLIWSRAVPSSVNASPAVAGGHVWVMAMENMAFLLDPKDGAITKELEQDFTLEASPLLTGDMVIYEETSLSAQVPESRLHAVDAATGAERWHHDYLHAAGRAPSTDGERVFVASNDGVHAVRLADGAKLWTHSFPLLVRVYSPVVAGGLVIVSGGSYEPGHLTALDPATGAVKWSVRTAGRIGAPIAIAGEEILVPVMDGKVHRHALKDGADAGVLDPGGRTDARPAVSATRIYVPVGQTVVAFDRATLQESWRLELEDLAVSDAGIEHLAVLGSKLLGVRLDGHVHALVAPGGA